MTQSSVINYLTPEPLLMALVPDDAPGAILGFAKASTVAFGEQGGSAPCRKAEEICQGSVNSHTTMRAAGAF
jgi:hypothetical protein